MLTADIRPGRRPRGPALPRVRRGVPPASRRHGRDRSGGAVMTAETSRRSLDPGRRRPAGAPRNAHGWASSPTPASASAARPARSPARSGTRSPRTALTLTGMSYDNTGGLSARHLAARRVHRAAQAAGPPAGRRAAGPRPGARPSTSGCPGATVAARGPRRLPATTTRRRRQPNFRWLMSSDVCKHCTHAACLDVCPTGRADPHRVRHRRRAGRRLQRLRLLRAGLPVRRHRQAPVGRRHAQVHPVLRPARRRHGAGLRQDLPDRVDPVRPLDELRERAQARVEALHEAGVPTPGCTATTRPTASAATAPSSCCSTSPRSTGCRPTRSSPPGTCPGCGGAAASLRRAGRRRRRLLRRAAAVSEAVTRAGACTEATGPGGDRRVGRRPPRTATGRGRAVGRRAQAPPRPARRGTDGAAGRVHVVLRPAGHQGAGLGRSATSPATSSSAGWPGPRPCSPPAHRLTGRTVAGPHRQGRRGRGDRRLARRAGARPRSAGAVPATCCGSSSRPRR